MTPDDRLVRLDVAARELNVTQQTIKKYCRCGLLLCVQLPSGHWRVWRSSLNAVRDQPTALPKE
jgi:predicted site-specific integrase-resolvase